MTYTLRNYQSQAVDAGLDLLQNNKPNGIIVLPTGAGKSIVISSIADGSPGATLILQPSKEILEQNFLKLKSLGRDDVSIYSASMGIKRIDKITLATIGSIHGKHELFKEFDQILVDECDLVNSVQGMYKEFFHWVGKPVLGFTASPWRLQTGSKVGEKHIGGGRKIPIYSGGVNQILTRGNFPVFKNIIHITQIQELYDQGFLCPLEYVEGLFDRQYKLTLNSSGNDYSDATYKRISSNVIADAVRAVYQTEARSHLIFMKRIEDAEEVSKQLNQYGISCAVVSGETKASERERILKAFIAGDIEAVANVGVLTVGFDHPQLDHIVLGRPVNSARLYYQMLGRGIRIHPDKKKCTLTDLCGNVDRLGKIEDWRIEDRDNDGCWRLYNKDRPLTGIDLKSGTDLEKGEHELGNQTEIHFGKHKGTKIADAPTTYLEWIRDNFSPGHLRNLAIDEITRRSMA